MLPIVTTRQEWMCECGTWNDGARKACRRPFCRKKRVVTTRKILLLDGEPVATLTRFDEGGIDQQE